MTEKAPATPMPVAPTQEQQEVQQALQAVQHLYEVTATTPAPRNIHIQCEQMKNLLIAHLTKDQKPEP
ncbi:MAG: hypothetical protein GY906_24775 [bacterium]|nr:hypothetical protein [bacterium]